MRGAVVLLAILAGAAPTRADTPDDSDLVWAGLAMAPPTYFLGVIVHEGSHALWAKAYGYEVTRFKILPGRHPQTGAFYFGYTSITGRMPDGEKTWFLLAPKITDTVLLGGYSLAIGTDTIPDNRYGRLALAVLATGFWVDFSKDILSFRDSNDMVRIYNTNGAESEWERLPWRATHLALSVGAAYFIYKGYEGVFEDDDPEGEARVILPLWHAAF